METIGHLFFDCRFARMVWGVIYLALGVPKPHSVSNMFGQWLGCFAKNLRSLALLGAATTVWSLWMNRNDFVFEKKKTFSPLQVIYAISHWLRTWVVLQKAESRPTVVEVTQCLVQVAKEFFTRAHG